MIAQSNAIYAAGIQFLGNRSGNSQTAGSMLAVDDAKIHDPFGLQLRQNLAQQTQAG